MTMSWQYQNVQFHMSEKRHPSTLQYLRNKLGTAMVRVIVKDKEVVSSKGLHERFLLSFGAS